MKKSQLLVLGVLLVQLAACTTTPRVAAPVERRTTNDNTGMTDSSKSAGGVVAGQEGPGFHTVKPGETLYRIALEAGQSYHDLVAWNNLSNPNDIKVGQVLRVQPQVAGGAQMGAVTTTGSGIEVRPLGNAAGTTKALPGAMNNTTPRGDKRAYSDKVLAELEKPDGVVEPTAPAVVAPVATPAPVAPTPVAEVPAKPAVLATPEDAATTWIWPTQGKVSGVYDPARKGVDISGKVGQTIVAAADGRVMYAGSGIRGYGNLVILKHTNNLLSAYAHNRAISVKEGQSVTKGQKIAEMGDSDSSSVKLHFEIRQQGKPVDPTPYLPAR